MAFHAFVSGQAPFATFRQPGFYAVAIRFVQTQTGQATELVPLGVVQVS